MSESYRLELPTDNDEFAGRKTKLSNPYDYDPFTVWSGSGIPTYGVYTDRLFQWGHEKYDDLCKKHFGNKGQYWGNRDPKAIQNFLRDYLENPAVVLCEVVESCNPSNGYPVWCLRYNQGGKNTMQRVEEK